MKFVELTERNGMHDKVGTPDPPKMLINQYHILKVTEDGEDACTVYLTDGSELKLAWSIASVRSKLNG